MSDSPTVFLVDDDDAVRDALTMLVRSIGFRVEAFSGADAFLSAYRPEVHGCVILDVRMPGKSGLELQEEMVRLGYEIPIIFISGHADVPMAVRAMSHGAVYFLEKPVRDQDLLEQINLAVAEDRRRRERTQGARAVQQRLDQLTDREREVMDLMVTGKHTKEIALALNVSPKTVEFHRANLYSKLGVDSPVALIRLVQGPSEG